MVRTSRRFAQVHSPPSRLLGRARNALRWDFSVGGVMGYRIENGRVVGRVEDAMVTRDAHSMLTGPGAVASGPEWIGVFRGAPRVERTGVPLSMKE